MTFDELHAAHMKLWDWLAENPWRAKTAAPEELKAGSGWNYCFACVRAEQIRASKSGPSSDCAYCPVEWPSGGCETDDPEGLHLEWCNLYDNEMSPEALARRAELARIIRDLPWVEK